MFYLRHGMIKEAKATPVSVKLQTSSGSLSTGCRDTQNYKRV